MATIKYKMIKQAVPICPNCGGQLMGDNSSWNPFTCGKCDCIWKASPTDPFNYEMMKREIL